MTWPTELDAWAADLGTATGLHVTRNPDLVHPPCVFVGTPETVTAPITGAVLELPCYVIAGGSGQQELDGLLTLLPTVLDATGQQLAVLTPITVSEVPLNAYLVTVQVRITT